MSGGYSSLARFYDRLNSGVDYGAWADFFEVCFDKILPSRPRLVLDLACGTGKMTYELLGRGYDMIGLDASAEMLSEAAARRDNPENPLLLLGDMRDFELYGSVGAVVCCLDGINHLTGAGDIERCFCCVRNYLDPGGVFLFDVNTPFKFENIFGENSYILEDDAPDGAVFCGWRNYYNKKTRLCDFYLTLFEERKKGAYTRSDETWLERCYSLEELRAALLSAGLEFCGVWGDFGFGEPGGACERWYIAAKKPAISGADVSK